MAIILSEGSQPGKKSHAVWFHFDKIQEQEKIVDAVITQDGGCPLESVVT